MVDILVLYKNEISESGLLNDKKDIPVLTDNDTLIVVAYVSNFNDKSYEASVYAAGYDENGNMVINVPGDNHQISYAVDVCDKAKLYINGRISDCKGILNGNNILFKVVAEDKTETTYRILINNK